MMRRLFIALAIVEALLLPAARGDAPATQPTWDPSFFNYDKPDQLVVEESTPTAAQLNWMQRPPQLPADAPDPKPSAKPAKPAQVGGINILYLRFKDADGQIVPVLLCTPRGNGPFPVVVAVHGLGSNKAQVCAQIAPSLVAHGFAVVAPDMPLHGERPGEPHQIIANADPLERFRLARRAIIDVRMCIDLAEQRPELDTKNGIVLVGYSLGSWIDAAVGGVDDRVKEMVLMVGGATDIPPEALLIPQIAAIDPRLAIAHFAGRPLLMLSARDDNIVTPEMSRRLFDAAPDPKKQIWYDSGHILPAQAYSDAGEWVAQTWEQLMNANKGESK